MKKTVILAAGALISSLILAGCGSSASSSSGSDTVNLTVWGGELQTSQDYLKTVTNAFAAANPETKFSFTIGAISEAKVKDEWVKDPENAADVAIAADDQLYDLAKGGYVQDITKLSSTMATDIESRNGALSVSVCKYNNDLYAYPVSASNGFFLYYDSSILSATDVDDFDTMMAAIKTKSIADSTTYQFGFPFDSGWYLEGFYRGAGFTIDKDSTGKNNCTWNSTTGTPSGFDVSSALLTLSSGDYKAYWNADTDANLMVATAAGTAKRCVATINGTWSADTVKANYGEHAAATVLPTYSVNGTKYRMKAVAGHKIAIVNSFSKNVKWASKLADYMTTSTNQVSRYTTLAEAPTNTDALTKVDLTTNYAVKALSEQITNYGFVQNVGGEFWTASGTLDKALNTGLDGEKALIESGVINATNLQSLLDTCVTAINATPAA